MELQSGLLPYVSCVIRDVVANIPGCYSVTQVRILSVGDMVYVRMREATPSLIENGGGCIL